MKHSFFMFFFVISWKLKKHTHDTQSKIGEAGNIRITYSWAEKLNHKVSLLLALFYRSIKYSLIFVIQHLFLFGEWFFWFFSHRTTLWMDVEGGENNYSKYNWISRGLTFSLKFQVSLRYALNSHFTSILLKFIQLTVWYYLI